ncbi:MAG TPA: hypothetical protein VLI42_05550, partial [Chthoniobacterales bacterium]|nr:hypothetical protein [Chthoniobacterales bacterium]
MTKLETGGFPSVESGFHSDVVIRRFIISFLTDASNFGLGPPFVRLGALQMEFQLSLQNGRVR